MVRYPLPASQRGTFRLCRRRQREGRAALGHPRGPRAIADVRGSRRTGRRGRNRWRWRESAKGTRLRAAYLLDSIAAVTIGGTSLAGGEGSVIGTLMGVIILGTINNIMNLLNISPMMQPAVKGLVILVAVYINSRRERG